MDNQRVNKLGSITALSAFTVGIVLSRQRGVTGYEQNMFTAAPAFWAAIAVGLCIGVFLTFATSRSSPGIILTGVSIALISTYPLARGYFYWNEQDAITHLGMVRDFMDGTANVFDAFYPATHTFGMLLVEITGIPPRRILMIIAPVFMVVWLVGMPLAIRAFQSVSKPIAWLSGAAVLLILPVSIWPRMHPSTFASLFTPICFYLLLKTDSWPYNRYREGGLFMLATLALLFMHPQVALGFVGFATVYLLTDRFARRGLHDITAFLPLALISGVSLYWISTKETFISELRTVLRAGGGGQAGAGVGSRLESLTELGVSVVEFAFRMGGKYVIFGVLAAAAIGVGIRRRRIQSSRLHLAIAGAPLIMFMAIFIITGNIGVWTRFFALLMIPGTILGAVGLEDLRDAIAPHSTSLSSGIVAAILLVTLLLSGATMIPSVVTISPNEQVVESTYNGYEIGFEARGDGEWYHIRSRNERYQDAIYGSFQAPEINHGETQPGSSRIPDHFDNNSLHERDGAYLSVSEADTERETGVYQGLRYTREDFGYLRNQPGINRVIDTEGYRLYQVPEGEL